MPRRLRFLIPISLAVLVVAIAFYVFTRQNAAPQRIFPATINRDCAPWDGSAFTVSIPMNNANLSISIYQAGIKFPTTFSFPDETMRVGNVLLIQPIDPPEPLSGNVSFQHVEQGKPVEGTFDFRAETGQNFRGKFRAEWGNDIVYCG